MFERLFSRVTRSGGRWKVAPWWPGDTHAARQRSLLRLLAIAHSERLDTARLIQGFAHEHRGVYRMRLSRLAHRIAEGTPMIEALEQTPEVLSDETVLAIRFGSQTGTLPETFEMLSQQDDAAKGRARRLAWQSAVYAGLMILALGLSFAFLAVFILPVMNEVLANLQVGISGLAFHWLTAMTNFMFDQAILLLVLALVAGWLFWSPPSRRFFRRHLAPRWLRGTRLAQSAEILRLMAVSIEAGRPLPSAISTLARYHFDKGIRAKLLLARNEMEQGEDTWASLARARLLSRTESIALAHSSSTSIQVWTLRQLADTRHSRASFRLENSATLIQPAVTLLFAFFVLLGSMAIIGSLAEMIGMLA